jgi:hypothetical protein
LDETAFLLKLLEAEEAHQLKSRDELWFKGDLRFLLHDAQKLIYDAFWSTTNRETVILASRRFGKSFLSVVWCLEYAIRNPRTIVRFIPPEIKQAFNIVQPTFLTLEQSWPNGLIRYHSSEKAWQVGKGSWLYLGGFDSQKDASRGGQASLIVCDEAGFTNPDEYNYILKSVLKPQLLTTRGRLVIPSTPSRIPSHPFMSETVADAKIDGRLHTFTIYDNPMLDAEQIEEAKRDCGGEESEDFKREYLCQVIRSASIAVLPRYSADRCVESFELDDHWYRAIVGDFGGVTDKTVIHAIAYRYRSNCDGDVMFIDERVYDANTTTKEIVEGITELHKLYIKTSKAPEQDDTAYLDCPGQLQVDLNNQHNLNVRIPIKDEFHSGVNLINLYINQNRIKLHPRCKFTAMTFEAARFNDRRTDYIRNPVLGHCDAIASAIYGIRMICKDRDGSPIPKVNPEKAAWWKQPVQESSRQQVADAIYGRKKM